VEPRAGEPAIDGLESEVRDRGREFANNRVIFVFPVKLPFDFVQIISGTADEIRAFEAIDDLLDDCLLQPKGEAQPMGAGSVRRISGERIVESDRDQDLHLQRLWVDGVSRGEDESAKRRCSEGRECYGSIAPAKVIMGGHAASLISPTVERATKIE